MELPNLSGIFEDWQIEELIGAGSYGKVYKAKRDTNGIVTYAAIKIISIPTSQTEIDELDSEGMSDEDKKAYFKETVDSIVNEIKIMESVRGGGNIVSIDDYKVVEKTDSCGFDIYIRMELLTPLNDYTAGKPLREKEIVKLGTDICNALEICEKKNIVHRDIKPENIFVNEFGNFKLGDFGIACTMENATHAFSQTGTFNYMAPEAVFMKSYDDRVDIYSLGLVLYKLSNNNRMPYTNPDKKYISAQERKEASDARLRGDKMPAPTKVSEKFGSVILKASAFSPEARFKTASEFKAALLNLQGKEYKASTDTEPIRNDVATTSTEVLRTYPIPWKKILASVGAFALVVALAVGSIVYTNRNLSGAETTPIEEVVTEEVVPVVEETPEETAVASEEIAVAEETTKSAADVYNGMWTEFNQAAEEDQYDIVEMDTLFNHIDVCILAGDLETAGQDVIKLSGHMGYIKEKFPNIVGQSTIAVGGNGQAVDYGYTTFAPNCLLCYTGNSSKVDLTLCYLEGKTTPSYLKYRSSNSSMYCFSLETGEVTLIE